MTQDTLEDKTDPANTPTIHLRKLCVGVASIEELQEWQDYNLASRGGQIWHITRSWPKRTEELLKGGSLYWIIKGAMSVRQPIVGFEEHKSDDPDEKPKCKFILGPELIPTLPWPHRPFQGWRYLKPNEAPPDVGAGGVGDGETMPPEMLAELKSMGLL